MSSEENISLHKALIQRCRSKLVIASDRRLNLVHLSVLGARRALEGDYNEDHYESSNTEK